MARELELLAWVNADSRVHLPPRWPRSPSVEPPPRPAPSPPPPTPGTALRPPLGRRAPSSTEARRSPYPCRRLPPHPDRVSEGGKERRKVMKEVLKGEGAVLGQESGQVLRILTLTLTLSKPIPTSTLTLTLKISPQLILTRTRTSLNPNPIPTCDRF